MKKKESLDSIVQKLKKAMASADYEVKVPVDVRTANSEKLINSEGELDRLGEAMEALKLM